MAALATLSFFIPANSDIHEVGAVHAREMPVFSRIQPPTAVPVDMLAVYTPPHPSVLDSGGNAYPLYQCTWYVKSRRSDIPNHLGDAMYWFGKLAALGWETGFAPRAGAIGQSVYGNHVVYIEYLNPDGSVHLSERNYDYMGSYRERDAPAADFKYIY